MAGYTESNGRQPISKVIIDRIYTINIYGILWYLNDTVISGVEKILEVRETTQMIEIIVQIDISPFC